MAHNAEAELVEQTRGCIEIPQCGGKPVPGGSSPVTLTYKHYNSQMSPRAGNGYVRNS